MANFVPYSGQSNFDIQIQNYGTGDYFIKMLSDSGVKISSNTGTSYTFDQTLTGINTNFTGIYYATQFQSINPEEGYVLTQDGGFVLTQDTGFVLTS